MADADRPTYELTKPIARGRTAEVFDAGPGRVLKLYNAGWPATAAEREYEIAQKLTAAGVSAPRAFGLDTAQGRSGIVYERIDGASMLDLLPKRPWKLAALARELASLHAQLHAHHVAGLPSYVERLDRDLRRAGSLPPNWRAAALRLLDTLPAADALCHGDFHPANVIMAPGGPVIIDWVTASGGNPLADVARTVVLTRFGPLGEHDRVKRTLFTAFSRLFMGSYLGRYLALTRSDRHELRRWEAVSAAARLADDIPEERTALLKFAQRALYLYAPV